MIKSIQQFQEEGIVNLENIFIDYSDDLTKIAEMVTGVKDGVLELARNLIAEEWEFYDERLKKDRIRKEKWEIVRTDETSLLTSIGTIRYHKTYYRDEETGEYCYLLDKAMGLHAHERMTEDAEAELLKEAVASSYRKGGECASITDETVSKETVMHKIHRLEFPKVEAQTERKQVRYLYIDADEDHVSLQYINEKGDIKKPRTNTIMPRLVYIYEGVDRENKRHELLTLKHFGGVYEDAKGVEILWKEVGEYIEESYDTDYLEKVYINGDGAGWIKSGAVHIEKGKFVLDRFHMHKYIIKATSHLMDSADDARSEIYRAIRRKEKHTAETVFNHILEITDSEAKRKTVQASKDYILGNWTGIMRWIRDKNENIECSAEGHVSHVLSARMSSRPLGWSKVGADKMSRLRIYEANGGDMLELVRYQKRILPKAAGCEKICSSAEMFAEERKQKRELVILADIHLYEIPYPQIKKMAALKNQIWGL